jgi:hypothetical protein
MADYATISRKIWTDPEFTGLTVAAQHLYFLRKTTKQRTRYDAADVAKEFGYRSVAEVETAAELLRNTRYGYVLNKGVVRTMIPLTLRHEVYAHDGWKCVYCGSKKLLEVDHIMPIAKGGTDDRDNLQTLCRPCNRRKGVSI